MALLLRLCLRELCEKVFIQFRFGVQKFISFCLRISFNDALAILRIRRKGPGKLKDAGFDDLYVTVDVRGISLPSNIR